MSSTPTTTAAGTAEPTGTAPQPTGSEPTGITGVKPLLSLTPAAVECHAVDAGR